MAKSRPSPMDPDFKHPNSKPGVYYYLGVRFSVLRNKSQDLAAISETPMTHIMCFLFESPLVFDVPLPPLFGFSLGCSCLRSFSSKSPPPWVKSWTTMGSGDGPERRLVYHRGQHGVVRLHAALLLQRVRPCLLRPRQDHGVPRQPAWPWGTPRHPPPRIKKPLSMLAAPLPPQRWVRTHPLPNPPLLGNRLCHS